MKKLAVTIAALLLLALCVNAQSNCPNCLDCGTQNNCRACADGYESDVRATCVGNVIDKCTFYNINKDCFSCQPTYKLTAGKCEKMMDGCVSANLDKCSDCGFGTTLTDGKCKGVLNCASPADNCPKCRDGYQLQGNICMDISVGCSQANKTTGACMTCKTGYFMSGLNCFENKYNNPRCYILSDKDNCQSCKQNFNPYNGQCLLSKELIAINQGTSTLASFKFNATETTSSSSSSSSTSTTSTSTFSSISGFGSTGSSSGFDSGFGSAAGSTGFGSSGSAGFGSSGSGSTGFESTSTSNFGSSGSTTGGFGSTDTSGGFGSTGTSGGFGNSGTTTTTTTTTSSNTGGFGSTGATTTGFGSTGTANNSTSSNAGGFGSSGSTTGGFGSTGTTTTTNNNGGFGSTGTSGGFGNTGATTTSTTANNGGFGTTTTGGFGSQGTTGTTTTTAAIGNTTTTTTAANISGAAVTTTISTTTITTTPTSAVVTNPIPISTTSFGGAGGSFTPIPNCQVYNPAQPGVCISCVYGYYPLGATCAAVSPTCDTFNVQTGACFTCKFSLSLINGNCVDNNCQNSNSGKCLQCVAGYLPDVNGICVKNDPFCVDSINGRCQQCRQGYFVKTDGVCYILPPNCQIANIVNGDCLECVAGYQILSPGSPCVQQITIANCNVYDPSNPTVCLICAVNYYPTGNTCSKASAKCQTSNPVTGACTSCIGNSFNLVNGVCNDPNCLSPNGDSCLQCRPNFIFNNNELICKLNDPNCANLITEACLQCKSGYSLSQSGLCQISLPNNCLSGPSINICLNCAPGYSLTSNSQCVQTVANCQTYGANSCAQCFSGYNLVNNLCIVLPQNCQKTFPNGECQTCNPGFTLNAGICSTGNIAGCQNYAGSTCLSCSAGFYLINNSCLRLPPNCLSVFSNTSCQQCQQGYELVNGQCRAITIIVIPNCNTVDPLSNRCLACVDRYYISGSGCAPVPASCLSYNPQNGACFTCVPDYSLQGSQCVFIGGIIVVPANPDPNCLQYSAGICQKCSNQYYYSQESGKCIPVNPLCRQSNSIGECTACYPGYVVFLGRCIISQVQDPNCKTPNAQGCAECYNGYFYSTSENVCKRVNPLCKTFNPGNGYCLTCYPGYDVNPSNGNCEIFFRDPNCMEFNGNLCTRCSIRYYLGSGGRCIGVNPLCKEYNNINGDCTGCYPGYSVSEGKCIVGGNTDTNCRTSANNVCQVCYTGYYVSNGRCQQVNPLCRTFDPASGNCTGCYPGYDVSQGTCAINQAKDLNCRTFDAFNRNLCIQCYQGYLVIGGICKEQNPLCKTIDKSTGSCLSCYPGYSPSAGTCTIEVVTVSQYTGSQDVYCIKSENGKCVQCSNGYYLSQATNFCVALDPLCRSSNMTNGQCLSCYQGYVLSNGRCVISVLIQIPNCLTVNSQGQCSECIDRYFYNGTACQYVQLCKTFNKTNGNCLSCFEGNFLQDNTCVYPAYYDVNCNYYTNSYCTSCVSGYYPENYTCRAVDPFCRDFDYANKRCLACSGQKTPQGAICI